MVSHPTTFSSNKDKAVRDQRGRSLGTLRISVTDRCNFRCSYCMPEEHYQWLEKKDILSFEEILQVALSCYQLGLTKIRITGGEPCLRKDLPLLVSMLKKALPEVELALTTNGSLFEGLSQELKQAGLDRVTFSLDTLQPQRFKTLTKRDQLDTVLSAIKSTKDWKKVKIDSVIMRGVNHDEIPQLLDFAHSVSAELRFIEYMNVGGATQWSSDKLYSCQSMLSDIKSHWGSITELSHHPQETARTYQLSNGQVFGIIASMTKPFCAGCNRLRMTADGHLYTCLYAIKGHDVRSILRSEQSSHNLEEKIQQIWTHRNDAFAEQQALEPLTKKTSYISLEMLKSDSRLEMHTRGG